MSTSELYDTDYGAWARRQVELLHAGRFGDLDVDHLVLELQDMGRSERNELESRLVVLLAHLLKWRYQYHRLADRWQEFRGDSWRATIIEQRDRIARRLQRSPGLAPALGALVAEAYADAVGLAAKESGLSEADFPATCPWPLEQVLDEGFYPGLPG